MQAGRRQQIPRRKFRHLPARHRRIDPQELRHLALGRRRTHHDQPFPPLGRRDNERAILPRHGRDLRLGQRPQQITPLAQILVQARPPLQLPVSDHLRLFGLRMLCAARGQIGRIRPRRHPQDFCRLFTPVARRVPRRPRPLEARLRLLHACLVLRPPRRKKTLQIPAFIQRDLRARHRLPCPIHRAEADHSRKLGRSRPDHPPACGGGNRSHRKHPQQHFARLHRVNDVIAGGGSGKQTRMVAFNPPRA